MITSMSREKFHSMYGSVAVAEAVCDYTPLPDLRIILSLLDHFKPKRILEIGTANGCTTANFTHWSEPDAQIFTIGSITDLDIPHMPGQNHENPTRADYGKMTNHFKKIHKVMFITADSRHYDFSRVAPIDYAFIDGSHAFLDVISDSEKTLAVTSNGGVVVWHDVRSKWSPEVTEALESLPYCIHHVENTSVGFMVKHPIF